MNTQPSARSSSPLKPPSGVSSATAVNRTGSPGARQRLPQGSRGRPRKGVTPLAPPPRFKDRYRRYKQSPYFWLTAALATAAFVGLIFLAARILSRDESSASRIYDSSGAFTPFPGNGGPQSNSPRRGKAEILTNEQGDRITPEYEFKLDKAKEAVTNVLADTWNLPAEGAAPSAAVQDEKQATIPLEQAKGDSTAPKKTLEELYAEMPEGMTVDNLVESLNEAYRLP